jgi:DNA-binding NtrC family response regulator
VDARLIALTNVDLDDAVKRHHFREDLYYRLHVVHIEVPALRDRREDLPELATAFVKSYSAKHGRQVSDVSPEAQALLSEYQFPGNVRELANTIERAVIVSSGKLIELEDLPEPIRIAVSLQRRRAVPQSLAAVEAEYVTEILAAAKGNKTEAARILGISRKNLYEKLARQEKGMRDEGSRMKDEG